MSFRAKLFFSLQLAFAIGGANYANAQDFMSMSCGDLWQQRNQTYKDNGYCFSTPRAIAVFGNAGCRFDRAGDVPMSNDDRAMIAAIAQAERLKGCSN